MASNPMKPIRSVYLMTDLEGVAGVDAWDPRHDGSGVTAQGVDDRREMRDLLTGEVAAAIEGLRAAGVDRILVNDGHGVGRTIHPEALPAGVRLIRGAQRPAWLLGLDGRFDALMQLGMHAMGGTADACLAHTMARPLRFEVNGRALGEMQMAAYLAGALGIPWVFTAGDSHACDEARAWVPGMACAVVKEGLSEQCAIHLPPAEARDLIRRRIQDAVSPAHPIEALTLDGPVAMTVHDTDQPLPDAPGPGLERVDEHTVIYRGDSFWSVFHGYFYDRPGFPVPRPAG